MVITTDDDVTSNKKKRICRDKKTDFNSLSIAQTMSEYMRFKRNDILQAQQIETKSVANSFRKMREMGERDMGENNKQKFQWQQTLFLNIKRVSCTALSLSISSPFSLSFFLSLVVCTICTTFCVLLLLQCFARVSFRMAFK